MLVTREMKTSTRVFPCSYWFVSYADVDEAVQVRGLKIKNVDTEKCSLLLGYEYVQHAAMRFKRRKFSPVPHTCDTG